MLKDLRAPVLNESGHTQACIRLHYAMSNQDSVFLCFSCGAIVVFIKTQSFLQLSSTTFGGTILNIFLTDFSLEFIC